MWIAGVNQADSYHEPAFVTAPERIDLLLDENGNPIKLSPGQIALPIHYSITNQAKVGDLVIVDTGERKIDLEITGLIRDAQMNAAMVPSKRLVVHPAILLRWMIRSTSRNTSLNLPWPILRAPAQ